ncbi:MAG: hypothetical protein R3190_09640, partial [Thermoanaerobaculia bacterium]|nr:hypothetical protein [Thermoanaerobaculia bacterium]
MWLPIAALLATALAGVVTAAETGPEAEARATVERYFEAWNAADNEALREVIHLPHAFLVGAGGARIAESWDEIAVDFGALRRTEGWSRSTFDSAEATHVAPGQVHLELVFSRLDAEGRAYRTVPALWILTRRDGRWGVQVRSILGGPAGGVDEGGRQAAEAAAAAFFAAF